MAENPPRTFIIASNANGKVDVLEKGQMIAKKQLPIIMMQCSFQLGNYLLIGAQSKVYLVDLLNDFAILGSVALSRHVMSITTMNAFFIVCGQQGGQLALIQLKDGQIEKVAETKIASAIYKVVRTTQDDYALACSGGIFFAQYDGREKKFTKESDFFMADHVVTQLHEVSPNKFAAGCWGVPYVAIIDRKLRTLIKIECPINDELQCTDLIPLPSFNSRSFPFMLQRNSKALNLVNLATFSMHRLLMRPNQSGASPKTVIYVDKDMND